MEEVIIIKYGELTTKSDNINFFIKTLKANIEKKIASFDFEIKYDYGRMIIYTKAIKDVSNKLSEVFGIHEIAIGYLFKNKSLDSIKKNIVMLLKDEKFTSFRVKVKRSDKSYPGKSPEIGAEIGGTILKNYQNKKVLMQNSDITINVEIRLNEILIYFKGCKALGGYPVSTLGKGLLMLSGGIDSPVSGYLAIKRGVRLEAIYFDSPPHTSKMAKEKVEDLVKVLAKYNGTVNLHVINFTKIQEEIIKNVPKFYLITIMRRMMYRISERIAKRVNAHILINGENIGQVASQTLKSMEVINETIKMPVIRPVCTYDKLEIIALAKKIGTYEISSRPYEDCCTIFVPKHPVIHPDLHLAREYENSFDFESLIYEAIKTHEIIKIGEEDNLAKFTDLL